MKTSQVIVTSLSVLGAAGLGYAAYFDYRRRNDAAFRKGLIKDSKKTSKASKKEAAKKAKEEDAFIEDLLQEIRAPGVLPSGVEEREQYFLKYVSLGEQLFAMGADKHLEASAAFFRALKVYPQPVELIMIFQKAVPKEVFDTIMRIVSKDIASGGGDGESIGGSLDEVDDEGPSGLKEAVEGGDIGKEPTSSATLASAPEKAAQGTDSGTTSSQEWDTLSATSLTDTGVVVSPSAAKSGEDAAEPLADAAPSKSLPEASSQSASDSAPSSASEWTPAPVFGSPQKE